MTDRAVTTTLEYALSLAMATVVITGLLVAGGDFVEDRRDQVVRTELRVIGQQIASDVQRADRLARAGTGADRLRLNASYPDRVAGIGYSVAVIPDAKSGVSGKQRQLELTASEGNITVEIEMHVESSLATTSFTGGDVALRFDGPGTDLEVTSRG